MKRLKNMNLMECLGVPKSAAASCAFLGVIVSETAVRIFAGAIVLIALIVFIRERWNEKKKKKTEDTL